ncbi:uncharacterized protein [Miscanthus floridulus]|uniref:uncharacterized protein isoform X1 n=1 Tax=Miscanthus floridulus TaxID=154761 RepID=UPI00345B4954
MADQLLRMAAARRNAKDQCKEIKDIAYSAGRDLMAQRGNINNSSRVMAKLDALEESIGRARRLVTDCGKNDGNIMEQVWRLFTAEDISKELQQVKEDMLLKWAKANSAFIKDHGMAPNANPAGHRPPQLQQERSMLHISKDIIQYCLNVRGYISMHPRAPWRMHIRLHISKDIIQYCLNVRGYISMHPRGPWRMHIRGHISKDIIQYCLNVRGYISMHPRGPWRMHIGGPWSVHMGGPRYVHIQIVDGTRCQTIEAMETYADTGRN